MREQGNRTGTDPRTAINEPMPTLLGESRKLDHAPRNKPFGKGLPAKILRACAGKCRHRNGGRTALPHFATWLRVYMDTPLHIDAVAQRKRKAKRRRMLRTSWRATQRFPTSHLEAPLFILLRTLCVRASVCTSM